jgi:hypothetical protein
MIAKFAEGVCAGPFPAFSPKLHLKCGLGDLLLVFPDRQEVLAVSMFLISCAYYA